MKSGGFSGDDDSKLAIDYTENVIFIVAELAFIIEVLPDQNLPIFVT